MRLIDANEIVDKLNVFNDHKNADEHFLNGIETAREIIESAPTVEAVAVVRCKDCRYGVICIDGNGKELVGCNNFDKFDIQTYCGPYWYCADGER